MKNQLNFNIVSDEELSEANGGKLTFIQSTAAGDLYYNTNTHKYVYQQTQNAFGAAANTIVNGWMGGAAGGFGLHHWGLVKIWKKNK